MRERTEMRAANLKKIILISTTEVQLGWKVGDEGL